MSAKPVTQDQVTKNARPPVMKLGHMTLTAVWLKSFCRCSKLIEVKLTWDLLLQVLLQTRKAKEDLRLFQVVSPDLHESCYRHFRLQLHINGQTRW